MGQEMGGRKRENDDGGGDFEREKCIMVASVQV